MVDLEQYYPTPRMLAIKMAKLVPQNAKSLLEPSAGCGDLLKAVDNCRELNAPEIWKEGFEVDEHRARIANKQRYSTIKHGDFLTANIEKTYDCVIMNPPFRNAEYHFKKAYDCLRDGGKMIALMPSASLQGRNKIEQGFNNLLKATDAEIEIIEDAFAQKSAERKTNVEVALITLFKPVVGDLFEFGNTMKDEVKNEINLFRDDEEYNIKLYDFLGALVDNYERSKKAYNEFLNAYHELWNVKPEEVSAEYMPSANNYETFVKAMRRECWMTVFKKTELSDYMTKNMMKTFQEKQEKDCEKELTLENIGNLLLELKLSVKSITDEALKCAFDEMTKYFKENRCHIEGWKTNSAWKVNRKIILPNMLECPYGKEAPRYLNYSRSSVLEDIEKALCLMYGMKLSDISTNKHTSTIQAVFSYINEDDFGKWHDTYFFKVKVYKKRTMHLYFKDEKVWEDFNRRVCEGKMWIGQN